MNFYRKHCYHLKPQHLSCLALKYIHLVVHSHLFCQPHFATFIKRPVVHTNRFSLCRLHHSKSRPPQPNRQDGCIYQNNHQFQPQGSLFLLEEVSPLIPLSAHICRIYQFQHLLTEHLRSIQLTQSMNLNSIRKMSQGYKYY